MKFGLLLLPLLVSPAFAEGIRSLDITVDLPSDGKTDVADRLQQIIDANPNRTIRIPDGVYLLSHPICTPAHPKRSVDLRLSNYAVLKASASWNVPEALVRLGAKDPANDIYTVGSNYGLSGGVLDGSGKADGVSIDGGRETRIDGVSIKNVRIGVHIKFGANGGSSDADISRVNIVGNRSDDSIGVLVEGNDNTFSHMRIAHVQVGVELKGGGNSLRDIHPLYTRDFRKYRQSVGFIDHRGNNWYDFCYSDNFGTGFLLTGEGHSQIDRCFCMWYTDKGGQELALRTMGRFESTVNDLTLGFHERAIDCRILQVGAPDGRGVINRLHGKRLDAVTDAGHNPYYNRE